MFLEFIDDVLRTLEYIADDLFSISKIGDATLKLKSYSESSINKFPLCCFTLQLEFSGTFDLLHNPEWLSLRPQLRRFET